MTTATQNHATQKNEAPFSPELNALINEAVEALWLKHKDDEVQYLVPIAEGLSSSLVEAALNEFFDNWLRSKGLDDPNLMLLFCTQLVTRKYRNPLSINIAGYKELRGFVLPTFLIETKKSEYLQTSEPLLKGYRMEWLF